MLAQPTATLPPGLLFGFMVFCPFILEVLSIDNLRRSDTVPQYMQFELKPSLAYYGAERQVYII